MMMLLICCVVLDDNDAIIVQAGSFAWNKTGCTILEKWESLCMHMGHSMSNQQGILGHLSDFDETWCACSTYGAHHPYQLLAPYIT